MKNQSFNCLMKLAWLMVSWCKHCVCKCQNNASVLIVCPDRSLAPSPPLPPLCLSLAHAEPGLQPALVPPCLASPARLVLLLHQGPWPTGRGEASQRVLVRDLSGRRPPAPAPRILAHTSPGLIISCCCSGCQLFNARPPGLSSLCHDESS